MDIKYIIYAWSPEENSEFLAFEIDQLTLDKFTLEHNNPFKIDTRKNSDNPQTIEIIFDPVDPELEAEELGKVDLDNLTIRATGVVTA